MACLHGHRLHAAAVAGWLPRAVAAGDDVTVDVVSLEEAEAVLQEKRFELRKRGLVTATP